MFSFFYNSPRIFLKKENGMNKSLKFVFGAMLTGFCLVGNPFAQDLPYAATDYKTPHNSISLESSRYNPNDKMTPTADAIANDEYASSTAPMYQGAIKSLADLAAAYERLPYSLFPYKPYWNFKQDYYFWGKTQHDIIRKQYDNFSLDIIEYPQVLANEGTKQKLSRKMHRLADKKFITATWLNMPYAIPSGQKGLIPLIECIHHLASTAYAANPSDYDAFTKFMVALHLANMHVEYAMENEALGIINSSENRTLALKDNMKARTEFLLEISETNTSWATILDYGKFLVNEFNKINNSRDKRKGAALLHAYQYCEQAKLLAQFVIPRNKDAQKNAETEEYKKLLEDISAMDNDDVVIDCYFEISKPIAAPISKEDDATLNDKVANLMKGDFETFQKAIILNEWKVITETQNNVEIPIQRIRPVAVIYKFRNQDALAYRWISQKWNGSDFAQDVDFSGEDASYKGDRIKVDLSLAPTDYDKQPASLDRNAPGNEWMANLDDSMIAALTNMMQDQKQKEEAEKPFVFDVVYADYMKHVNTGDVLFLISKTDMYKLEHSAQTDEQKNKFKDLKKKSDDVIGKELEWGNTNFASATDKLLAKAKKSNVPEMIRAYIGAGMSMYDRYLRGDRKGKATYAQLKKVYDSYSAFIDANKDKGILFGKFIHTPDGKEIVFPMHFKFMPSSSKVCKDILNCYGEVKNFGMPNYSYVKLFRNGQFFAKVDWDGNIFNSKDKKVGFIDDKERIWINGSIKAENRFGTCFVNGKQVGEVYGNKFRNANDTHHTELGYNVSNSLFTAFILYFHKVIPQ